MRVHRAIRANLQLLQQRILPRRQLGILWCECDANTRHIVQLFLSTLSNLLSFLYYQQMLVHK